MSTQKNPKSPPFPGVEEGAEWTWESHSTALGVFAGYLQPRGEAGTQGLPRTVSTDTCGQVSVWVP